MSVSPVWLNHLVLIICGLINLIGLVGLFLVFFPGLTVAWIGQLIWVIYVGFNKGHADWQFVLTIVIFIVNTGLMILGSLLDNILGAKKTREKGVPWWEIVVTWLAMLVGGVVLTPLGGLAVALFSLYLMEYFRLKKDKKQAWEGTKALAFGYGSAALIGFFLCLVMVGLWIVMVVFL